MGEAYRERGNVNSAFCWDQAALGVDGLRITAKILNTHLGLIILKTEC